jgi:Rad3-related DNA helicase
MIPGIQKVTQAVGRVIRDAEDHGIALLLDDRFSLPAYRMLCPAHWVWQSGDLSEILKSLPPFGVSAG